MQEFRIHFVRIPRWQIMLGTGLVFALIVAFFVLAFGIFLLLLPALAIAAAIFYLSGGRRSPIDREGAANDRILDGEYGVIEQDRSDDRRDRSR
jgi:hypothetical protein